jgi:hypothetical protein
MFKWFRLIKWLKQQNVRGYLSFNVFVNKNEFIIWNPENDEKLRIKY